MTPTAAIISITFSLIVLFFVRRWERKAKREADQAKKKVVDFLLDDHERKISGL